MSDRSAILALEDGTVFAGRSVGADGDTFGEVVFNTAMTGYQEILTDPSYKGQLVCMTYPHIGNYGVNDDDVESRRPWAEGYIMRELSPIVSNHRAQGSLGDYLKQHGIVAIDHIDTRALTLKLRRDGSMKGGISTTANDPTAFVKQVQAQPSIVGLDLVQQVTCEKSYDWPVQPARGASTIMVIDCGVKYSILRQLAAGGCRVCVVPAATSSAAILARKPQGVVVSNGPGDPAAVTTTIQTVRELIGQVPMMGICLGHQILGLALGGKTFKLKFGHHGGNHPVQDVATGSVAITAQNHNFAVDVDSIPNRIATLTHRNLNDRTVEGMAHRELPIFSIQYHPEAGPGPHDARYLFGRFRELMEGGHA